MKSIEQSNKRMVYALLKVLGTGLLCFMSLYAYEAFPRFITFSISQPADTDYPLQPWIYPTYSVMSSGSMFSGSARYFIWREFTIVQREAIPEEELRQSIGKYYNDQLQKLGWTKSSYDAKSYTNCDTGNLFPEAFHLPSRQDFSEDGYVVYKKQPPFSFLTSKENDEVCLAIWRHWENVPGIFNVVISTIKPSPLTWFSSRNEFQTSE